MKVLSAHGFLFSNCMIASFLYRRTLFEKHNNFSGICRNFICFKTNYTDLATANHSFHKQWFVSCYINANNPSASNIQIAEKQNFLKSLIYLNLHKPQGTMSLKNAIRKRSEREDSTYQEQSIKLFQL